MTEQPAPFASQEAGQIAIQTMLSLLINLYIGECEDREQARAEIIKVAVEMVDAASVPGLPAAEQRDARHQAKALVRALISGQSTH
jgi:hypothetical protein